MYKALIADDEEIIRRGIAKFLSKDPEILVVAQAEDGETALELAAEQLPDLLFVDINMPFLNGLQFIEQLGGILKDAVIIVITGYDDFAYAQKALCLGVFDYLLKPIMEDTFYAAVDRAKELLGRTRKQVKYLEWARLQVERNKASLIMEFLDHWLDGKFSDTEVDERISYLNLHFPEQVGVTVVRFSNRDSRTGNCGEFDDDLLYYAAENIAGELFLAFSAVSTCRNSGGDLIVISSGMPEEEWLSIGAQVKSLLERHLPVSITLGQCGGGDYRKLPTLYERALAAADELTECSQIVKDTRENIERNYPDAEFSLQQAANAVFVTPQYLSRIFRHETGITFMDYVTRTRIRKAVQFLDNKQLKIYEVAERTGYSSQHYFSSAFKKVLGVSPLEYRKAAHSKQEGIACV